MELSNLIAELRKAADTSGNTGLLPYSLWATAADALSAKDRDLAEARAEIERLRRERDHWKFGHDASERARDEALSALREKEERVKALEADKARLDFLDACNAALNRRYGTNYGWSLVLSHNVTRLMLGRWLEVDLHDSEGGKAKLPSCRGAIDREMTRIDVERRARSVLTPDSREQRGEEA